MIRLRDILNEMEDPCQPGYTMLGMKMKDGRRVPNCVPSKDVTEEFCEACLNEYIEGKYPNLLGEAEYNGRKVSLGKPFRTPNGPKKFSVYVKNAKGNVVKVNFGDPKMDIKRDDPDSRSNFRARHNCSDKKDRTKAGYWSCKMWSKKPVSKITS